MKQWYRVNGYKAHVGAGRLDRIVIYVYAKNAVEALEIYENRGGVKRNKISSVNPLSTRETMILEKIICDGGNIKLSEVKNRGYYWWHYNTVV